MENNIYMGKQYSLKKILLVWFLITAPMMIVHTRLPFWLSEQLDVYVGYVVFGLIGVGLMNQFLVGCIVLKLEFKEYPKEQRNFKTLLKRLWLRNPISPKTGKTNKRIWWLYIPMVMIYAYFLLPFSHSSRITSWVLEQLPESIGFLQVWNNADVFASITAGQYWIIFFFLWIFLFNYFLGEEFIFRMILLPKMNGVFGKWDWVANNVLFTLYHVHIFFMMPASILLGQGYLYSYFSKRYKSAWFGILLHVLDGVFILTMTTLIVTGLASV